MKITRVLFVCGRNKQRSLTAESIFNDEPSLEVQSAGLNPDADVTLDTELIQWAEVIFVMEKSQLSKVKTKFKSHLQGKKLVSLDIPDNYEYMQPELVSLLEKKVKAYFGIKR
jgi:predicted protein tyrosine phosphatase